MKKEKIDNKKTVKARKRMGILSCFVFVALIMCFCLTGCGKTNVSNNIETNESGKQKEEMSNITVTEKAQNVASNFKLEYDKMGINYLIADGYMKDNNTGATVMLYLENKKENADRKEDFIKLVEYFKSISDDGKATDGYSEWESDVVSTTSVGTTCYIKLNGKEYKIYINQQNLTYNNAQYYTYNININDLAY